MLVVLLGLQACNEGGGSANSAKNPESCTTWECWITQDPSTWPSGLPSGFPGGGFPPSVTEGTNPNSSDGKILQDLQDRKITRDEAWVYQVQARLDRQALPAKYQPTPSASPSPGASGGPAIVHDETTLSPQFLNVVMAALPNMGLNAQLAVIPYLLPPNNKESYVNRAGRPPQQQIKLSGIHAQTRANPFTPYPARGIRADQTRTAAQTAAAACQGGPRGPDTLPTGKWVYVDDTHFRYWYMDEQGSMLITPAQYFGDVIAKLSAAFNSAKPKYEALTGQQILSDVGSYIFTAKDGSQHVWCDGGDSKVDVYLVDLSDAIALTVAYPQGCSKRPSFIVVDPSYQYTNAKVAEFTAAHELFHVFQNTFERNLSCDQYVDSDEGIANWAAHTAFPGNNVEHDYYLFTNYGSYSLITDDYPTWPFYLAMEKKFGTGWVRDLYTLEKGLSPIRAMDQIFTGGFKKIWPEFAVLGWNQEGNPPSFKQWDSFNEHPQDSTVSGFKIDAPVKLDGRGDFYYEKLLKFPMGLTRAYEHFKIDSKVKTFTLSWSTGGVEDENFHARAIIKRKGNWTVEDWDPKQGAKRKYRRQFCFDEPGVDPIEELVMVFARSDIEAPFGMWSEDDKMRLTAGANNLPCYVATGQSKMSESSSTGTVGSGSYKARQFVVNYNHSYKAKRDSDGQLTEGWELLSGLGDYAFIGKYEEYDPCATSAGYNILCAAVQKLTGKVPQNAFDTTLGDKTNTLGKVITCEGDLSGTFNINKMAQFSVNSIYSLQQRNSRAYGLSASPDGSTVFSVTYQCTDGTTSQESLQIYPFTAAGSPGYPEIDPNGHAKGDIFVQHRNQRVTWDFYGTK